MNDLRTATKAEAPFDCTLPDTNQRCLTLTHEPKRCRISASRISILMSQTLGQHTRIQHRLAPKPRPSRTVASIYHFAAIVQYPESPEIRGSWLGQVDTSASKTRSLNPGPTVKERKPPAKTQDLGGTLTWEPPEDQSQIEHYAAWLDLLHAIGRSARSLRGLCPCFRDAVQLQV